MDAVTGLEDAERLRGELRSFLGVDADLVAPTTELISTVREDGFARTWSISSPTTTGSPCSWPYVMVTGRSQRSWSSTSTPVNVTSVSRRCSAWPETGSRRFGPVLAQSGFV